MAYRKLKLIETPGVYVNNSNSNSNAVTNNQIDIYKPLWLRENEAKMLAEMQARYQIPIEERSSSEVLDIQINGKRVAPLGARARNPAFDVTPNYLFTALVTEKGIIHPPLPENLPRIARGA